MPSKISEISEGVREVAEKVGVVKKKEDPNWLIDCITDIHSAPPAKQCCVGAVAGAVNGYVFGRIGKNAAMAVGGSILLVQMASHLGYIQVNWRAVEGDINKAQREIKRNEGIIRPMIEDMRQFIKRNLYLGGGFVGGFLLGASAV